MTDKHQSSLQFLVGVMFILISSHVPSVWAKCQEFPFGHNPQAQIEWYKKQHDPDCERKIRTLEFLSAPTMPNLEVQPSTAKPPSTIGHPSHQQPSSPSTPKSDFYVEEDFDL